MFKKYDRIFYKEIGIKGVIVEVFTLKKSPRPYGILFEGERNVNFQGDKEAFWESENDIEKDNDSDYDVETFIRNEWNLGEREKINTDSILRAKARSLGIKSFKELNGSSSLFGSGESLSFSDYNKHKKYSAEQLTEWKRFKGKFIRIGQVESLLPSFYRRDMYEILGVSDEKLDDKYIAIEELEVYNYYLKYNGERLDSYTFSKKRDF